MQNVKVTDWNAVWKEAQLKSDIVSRQRASEALKNGDPAAIRDFLTDWSEAIEADKRITAFRNRSAEEKESYRKAAKESVEKNRWNGEAERTDAQLIADGRRRYQSDWDALIHFGAYN